MSDQEAAPADVTAEIERGTYEVLRDRLAAQGDTLRERAESLNLSRTELFGSTALEVAASSRLRTEHNCVPRDLIAVAGRLLVGFDVFLGLRRETRVEDVFLLLDVELTEDGLEFVPVADDDAANFLSDDRFRRDFDDLFRYYKHARLRTLRQVGDKLLAVFQTGEKISDVKALRWTVEADGDITYEDNQGDRDNVFPPSHDFEWTPTGRDDQVKGDHPHVSILDEVFVETVGGDLTVKVENNTASGRGIYAEPVEDASQSLDDAEIHYAHIGSLILLRVLPYRETVWRYLVFNRLTQTVERIDSIAAACVQLPEDHGIIFPGGYYLQNGDTKTFDADDEGVEFERVVRAPNGEDVLYVFLRRTDGLYVLLSYNLIRKEVANPIYCHGYSLLDDGRMVIFNSRSEEPTRVHAVQVWRTPFTSDLYAASRPTGDSFLERIGNRDLVRGISDALSLSRATRDQVPSVAKYEELIASAQRVLDGYHWFRDPQAGDLATPVHDIRQTASLVVDEFQKVQELSQQARDALAQADEQLRSLVRTLTPEHWRTIDPFVEGLTGLRRHRGRLITLRDVRYVDTDRLEELEAEVVRWFDRVSEATVEFLLDPSSLTTYHDAVSELDTSVEEVGKVADVKPLRAELERITEGLDLLTEIVGGLEIEDATQRTRILESISEVLARTNRSRALLEGRRKELAGKEGRAEFAAQFALFGQTVQSALALCETPDACDDQLSRLMLQLEDLEARFSEFDDYLEQLAAKREEVYEAVSSKKQQLLDRRQRRAGNLMAAVERVLTGVRRRAQSFTDADDLNAYFASDAMVTKVRKIVEELRELDQRVKADEALGRLQTAKKDAVRALRDRADIYEDGATVLRLGKHRFSVNTQALELTLVPRDGVIQLHLSGTDYHSPVDDQDFAETRPYWEQDLVSETRDVYRAEYLAACLLAAAEEGRDGLTVARLHEAALETGGLLAIVREAAASRYDEGYERGVHDADAAAILERVLSLYATAGTLRFSPTARAAACLFWARYDDSDDRRSLVRRAVSLGRLRGAFRHSPSIEGLQTELAARIADLYEAEELHLSEGDARDAGRYLFEELAEDPDHFVLSGEARDLAAAFRKDMEALRAWEDFERDAAADGGGLRERHDLVRAWLLAALDADPELERFRPVVEEAVVHLLSPDAPERTVSSALGHGVVEGLLGQHPRIDGRKLQLRLDEFLDRLGRFRHERVPGFRDYQRRRSELLDRERSKLRLSEFEPKVMSAFVRNRLIDEAYLPLIGDNLAKQMGALGEGKRTDLMGLLLLISPPGYGKTTLMEYLANRLGLVFVKVNGPALGHSVTSIDPAEAPNATARQEIEKIGLALEMGNNVLLYLDDIQHTHPELLQKFISLCDAQRRIEGVWRGRTRTYDLRGKRFVVCMAGNPYTESGETFQIPDMLANRADVYNLGDVLSGREDAFAMSYIENSLTSNAVLAQIAANAHDDIHPFVQLARGEEVAASVWKHSYSQVERDEIVAVLRKLLRVQEVVLAVNREYIRSASMEDEYRTEPPFKLQGSYRNMNKLAEKVVPVMNDAELEDLLTDHYLGEAQTLTTGAEQNLLKLGELRGILTDDEQARWEAIKESYRRKLRLGGGDDDPVVRVTGQLGELSERVKEIGEGIRHAADRPDHDLGAELGAALGPHLERLAENGSRDDDATAGIAPYLERLETVLDRLAEATAREPDDEGDWDGLGEALAPYVDRLDRTLSALAEREGSAAATPTVAAPKSDVDPATLMARQLQVIEVGLLPILRSMNHNLKISHAVWERLDEVRRALGADVDEDDATA